MAYDPRSDNQFVESTERANTHKINELVSQKETAGQFRRMN